MLLSAVILFQSTNVYLHLRNFVILQLATTTNIKIKKHNASLFLKKCASTTKKSTIAIKIRGLGCII